MLSSVSCERTLNVELEYPRQNYNSKYIIKYTLVTFDIHTSLIIRENLPQKS